MPAIDARVAGVQTPAFVERCCSKTCSKCWNRVAGVQTPAFVERGRTPARTRCGAGRVAGVQTPAFVERRPSMGGTGCRSRVSPEFRLRPSLSDQQARAVPRVRRVSPEFRLRPSLSGRTLPSMDRPSSAVSPEFRLRPSLSALGGRESAPGGRRVAGVQTPAFVERCGRPPALRSNPTCRRSSDSGLR